MGKSKRKRLNQESPGTQESGSPVRATLESSLDDTVKSFFEGMINGLKTEVFAKVDDIREELGGSVQEVNIKVDNLALALDREREKNARLEEKVKEMDYCLKTLGGRVGEGAQYSRSNNLKIYGLREERRGGRGENIFDTLRVVLDFLNNRLGLRVMEEDICICHRLGDYEDGRYRSVVVKFVRRMTKVLVLQNSHRLKHSGIVIAGDLTPERNKLFHELRERLGVRNVWTRDGKVFVNTQEGAKLVDFQNKEEVIHAVLHEAPAPDDFRPRVIGRGRGRGGFDYAGSRDRDLRRWEGGQGVRRSDFDGAGRRRDDSGSRDSRGSRNRGYERDGGPGARRHDGGGVGGGRGDWDRQRRRDFSAPRDSRGPYYLANGRGRHAVPRQRHQDRGRRADYSGSRDSRDTRDSLSQGHGRNDDTRARQRDGGRLRGSRDSRGRGVDSDPDPDFELTEATATAREVPHQDTHSTPCTGWGPAARGSAGRGRARRMQDNRGQLRGRGRGLPRGVSRGVATAPVDYADLSH